MLGHLEKWGPMTVLVFVAVVIVLVVGGAVVVVHPESLTFEDYLNVLWKAAAAAGLMGVARGVNLAGEKLADAHAFAQDMADEPDPADVEALLAPTERSAHKKLKG